MNPEWTEMNIEHRTLNVQLAKGVIESEKKKDKSGLVVIPAKAGIQFFK